MKGLLNLYDLPRRVVYCLGLGLTVTLTACAEAPLQSEGAIRALPPPQLRGERSLEEAIAGRRSVRRYTGRTLTETELSQLLWAAQGLTEHRREFRATPSAGATYPLEVYAVDASGVYRYSSREHRLERVTEGDRRPALAAAALGQTCVEAAPLVLVFAAVESRTMRRYGERGRRYVHMEVGHAAQNVHLQAVVLGLGSVPVGAFDPDQAVRAMGIRAGETVLYLVPVGEAAE